MLSRVTVVMSAMVALAAAHACALDFSVYRDGNSAVGGSGGSATGGSATGGSASGGSASGGSASGGSATGGSATGGSATGGSASGGSSSGGDATGGSSSGGMGGMMNDCPIAEPSDVDACADSGKVCTYNSGAHCQCWEGRWDCFQCPNDEPVDETSCQGQAELSRCFFGNTQCICRPSQTWNCGECPGNEPMTADNCPDTRAYQCAYGGTECSCQINAAIWLCN